MTEEIEKFIKEATKFIRETEEFAAKVEDFNEEENRKKLQQRIHKFNLLTNLLKRIEESIKDINEKLIERIE